MPLDSTNYHPCENARILRKAADLLRIHGWCRDVHEDSGGAMCIHGALFRAKYPIEEYDSIYNNGLYSSDEVGKILLEYALANLKLSDNGHKRIGVADWNNNSKTTKEEVIELLENAAKFAEMQEMEKVA